MPGFNLGGAVNSAADWACIAPVIRSVVSNPVFTALLITALATIVVMALYHQQIKHAGTRRAARAVLYVFLIVTAVVFVHHYAVVRIARDTSQHKGVRDVFSSIQLSRDVATPGDAVPVYPMGYEGGRSAAHAPVDPVGYEGGRVRADNVAVDRGGALDIEDVIVPAAASPFR